MMCHVNCYFRVRSLEMIEGLSKKEGGEDYKTFWESFGRNIKVGL